MHEHVGPRGEGLDLGAHRRVAAHDDRPAGPVDAVGDGRQHRLVVHGHGGDGHLAGIATPRRGRPARRRRPRRPSGGAAVAGVVDADGDVVAATGRAHRRRSGPWGPRGDDRGVVGTRDPARQHEVGQPDEVVGVVVGEQHGVDARQRHHRPGQPQDGAPPGVDLEADAVELDEGAGAGPLGVRDRHAGAGEHDPVHRTTSGDAVTARSGCGSCRCPRSRSRGPGRAAATAAASGPCRRPPGCR